MPDIEMAGSFLIGGMLLLSILALNASIMETATMNSLGTNAQENATVIVSILDYDFRKMGYRVASGTTIITTMTNSTITFLGDVDDNGSIDIVNYYLGPTSEPSGTGSIYNNQAMKVINIVINWIVFSSIFAEVRNRCKIIRHQSWNRGHRIFIKRF